KSGTAAYTMRTGSLMADGLAHAADAPCHRAHDVLGEVRHLVYHETKPALVDQGDLAGLPDARGRGSLGAVDHRHEADCFVGAAGLHHSVADHHLDHPELHDVHAGAGIALVENDGAGRIGDGGAGPPGKCAHIDLTMHFRQSPSAN